MLPILKWPGGKRTLLPILRNKLPNDIRNLHYYEPFIGGGALFFNLLPKRATISDWNWELINLYTVVRDNVEELMQDLTKHVNERDYYFSVRALDRSEDFKKMSNVERASRTVFLNKTAFNGLYRLNQKGQFNADYGKYKTIKLFDRNEFLEMSEYLKTNDITIKQQSYTGILDGIQAESFVYLDPPYQPISKTANFTNYSTFKWNEKEQENLKNLCVELDNMGIKFMQSNSNAELIKDLYSQFTIEDITAPRKIASGTTTQTEVLITNYKNFKLF